MGKSLVIVESPAKAKTINKYLGKDFIVKSSVGHVRDLPTSGSRDPVDLKARAAASKKTRAMSPEQKAKYKKVQAKKALYKRMGIYPENDWQADYRVLPGKEKVVNELKKLAKNSDEIYLATDLDREGEAIAWHLKELIGGEDARFKRVVFNEITKTAVQEAFERPHDLDLNYVNAQQTRRFLDRIVGFMVSPLLWKKIAKGLSAGRVQSVAVKLVVQREREIRAFIPEEYWELMADLKHTDGEISMQVLKYQGEKFKPVNKAQIDVALNALEYAKYEVVDRRDKPTSSKPSAPLITSSLQQAASTRLGFGVKKTMMLAQRLYEAGHITYMRTDSTALSADAVAACRQFVIDAYGENYLPANPVSYSSKEGAQEAHEAIRPSDVQRSADSLNDAEPDARKLYDLIWRYFVACQMTRAEYTSTTIEVNAADYTMSTRGRVMRFDGWTRVLTPNRKKDEDKVLPDINKGQTLNLVKLDPSQHFTKPPARYSEAALVKELEKRGIGRPSTYANIISTIQDRGYVKLESRRFYARKIGEIVTDRLNENFIELMDYGFTAEMEEHLDQIAAGKVGWKETMSQFYADFIANLEKADGDVSDSGMRPNIPVETDISCPECGRHMMIRTASTGVFLGCSGYSLPPKERCKKTLGLSPGEEAVAKDGENAEDVEITSLMAKKRCEKCGTAMESYLIDTETKLHVCGNNPDCDGYTIEKGEFVIKGYDGPVLDCDKCGSEMQLKNGRFGKYFGCTAEDCKNTRKLLRNGQPAPPKADPIPMPMLQCQKVDDTYVLRDGASGIFLAASQFPRNRETRAPTVSELLIVKDQLDPKFKFLTSAPEKDPKKRNAVIRYDRKSKTQYVRSETKDGKPTGWVARYNNGTWQADASKMKK